MNSPKFSTRKAHNAKDMTGQKIGRLLVLSYSGTIGNRRSWLCRCDCGNEVVRMGSDLRVGDTRSCGCLKRDTQTRHGMYATKEYRTWVGMRQRCSNPKSNFFHRYGGRGISVCEEWASSFECFYRDMGPCPSLRHSIERIDLDGNYEPSNCRWATNEEQANNTSRSRLLTLNGETRTMRRWADHLGMSDVTLNTRLARGWSPERAMTEPVQHRSKGRIGISCESCGVVFYVKPSRLKRQSATRFCSLSCFHSFLRQPAIAQLHKIN